MSISTAQPRTTTVAAPETRVPSAAESPVLVVRERGSFAHATCTTCGWRGPGRRARATCEQDGALHALTGCGI